MDPVGGSSLSLATNTLESEEEKTHQKYAQVLGSCLSVSEHEVKSLKNLVPQILAALAVMAHRIALGVTVTYSAMLVPQLLAGQNVNFPVTENDTSWIASILALITPVGSIMVGVLMDRFGRKRTMNMAVIPGALGWAIIACAQNVPMLIVGRALTGLSNALSANPSIVYLTEVARKDMRGSLINLGPTLASCGMTLTFLLGWVLDWRQVAWIATGLTIIPLGFLLMIPESPDWLVSKGQIPMAKQALEWFNKYQPKPKNRDTSLAEMQLAVLQRDLELKQISQEYKMEKTGGGVFVNIIRELRKPTGYKPLIILLMMSTLQQFTGIFVFLFYSISIFQEIGTGINPYLASVFIGIVRLVVCLLNTYVMKIFGRRPLVFFSAICMALAAFAAGFYSGWIQAGKTEILWPPIVFLLVFVMSSMMGVVPVPFTMAAEVFPLEIRGTAYSIIHSLNNITMFVALQMFPTVMRSIGVQNILYSFAVVSILFLVFAWIFMPETHRKKLKELEDYFRFNFVYLTAKEVPKSKARVLRNRRRSSATSLKKRRPSLRPLSAIEQVNEEDEEEAKELGV